MRILLKYLLVMLLSLPIIGSKSMATDLTTYSEDFVNNYNTLMRENSFDRLLIRDADAIDSDFQNYGAFRVGSGLYTISFKYHKSNRRLQEVVISQALRSNRPLDYNTINRLQRAILSAIGERDVDNVYQRLGLNVFESRRSLRQITKYDKRYKSRNYLYNIFYFENVSYSLNITR